MTKDGSFKRAVRDHARRTGQRYTQARAELNGISRPFADTRPVSVEALRTHLAATYATSITSVAAIDDDPATRPRGSWPGHYPWTFVVERSDGPTWIARVYSSAVDRVSRVQDDAEILSFLARHDIPAERMADEHPVSVLDGAGVIVTEFLPGGRPADPSGRAQSPAVLRELAGLLGRVHTLPVTDGAPARDGGSEEHDGGFHLGRPGQDLAAAMAFLVSIEHDVPAAGRSAFTWLRDQIENADDAEGLPEAFTHGNYHLWAAVGEPGALSVVGWAGSGRGPRLPSLAWLLRTASEVGPEYVDAVVRGYTEHVTLTDAELGRLQAVLDLRPLWLASLDYREAVRRGRAPTMDEGWTGYAFHQPEHSAKLAAQVINALA